MTDNPTAKAHSALSVAANVKTLIPILLDRETGQYQPWATLFKVQAIAHDVLHHIIPPTEEADKTAYQKAKAENLSLWKRLDAAVLQWMYATVSNEILLEILRDDDTAVGAWNRIANLFQDNRNSRAMYLNREFANLSLRDFPDTHAYCTRMKALAAQLASVGDHVNDHALVLRVLEGVRHSYPHFVTVMQYTDPLPTFDVLRSKLALEETTHLESTRLEEQESANYHAHHFSGNRNPHTSSPPRRQHQSGNSSGSGSNQQQGNPKSQSKKGRYNNKNQSFGSNNNSDGYNRTRSNSGGSGKTGGSKGTGGQQQQQSSAGGYSSAGPRPSWNQPPPWWWYMQGPWAAPPSPYPAASTAKPPAGNSRTAAGGYAFHTEEGEQEQHWVPTQFDQAFNGMTLNQPPPTWIMDTGATSHMTNSTDRDPPNEM